MSNGKYNHFHIFFDIFQWKTHYLLRCSYLIQPNFIITTSTCNCSNRKKNFKDFPHIFNIFASLLGSSYWFQQIWVYNKPGWFNRDIKISIEYGLDKDLIVQRSAITMISYWETCWESLHAHHLINDTVDADWAKLCRCDLDKDFTIKTAYRLIISKVTDMQGLELI